MGQPALARAVTPVLHGRAWNQVCGRHIRAANLVRKFSRFERFAMATSLDEIRDRGSGFGVARRGTRRITKAGQVVRQQAAPGVHRPWVAQLHLAAKARFWRIAFTCGIRAGFALPASIAFCSTGHLVVVAGGLDILFGLPENIFHLIGPAQTRKLIAAVEHRLRVGVDGVSVKAGVCLRCTKCLRTLRSGRVRRYSYHSMTADTG